MKRIFTLAAVALLMTTTATMAHDHREALDFGTLDADGSGEITVEDLTAIRDDRFDEVDANGDGRVDRAEFIAHAEERAAARAGDMFARLDADGDGVLSKDALAARMGNRGGRGIERMLNRFDTDNSGGISAEEFEAAKERLAGRRGGRHGGRGN